MTQNDCEQCKDESCSAKTKLQDETDEMYRERMQIQNRMCRIKHKIMVMSGKGGVGKSTVAVNTAFALAMEGKTVGLLDIDIHGPSVPTMLGVSRDHLAVENDIIYPMEIGSLKIVSVGFFLPDPSEPLIWRGPMKLGVIKQFLKDVEWGELDYLIIDAPPGTGDEPLTICQLVSDMDGAVIVTTPQEVALTAVRKSVNFCKQAKLPVIGVVENMSGLVCENCSHVTPLFQSGGGQKMAEEMKVPFLGTLPIDPAIGQYADQGKAFIKQLETSETGVAFKNIIKPVIELDKKQEVKK